MARKKTAASLNKPVELKDEQALPENSLEEHVPPTPETVVEDLPAKNPSIQAQVNLLDFANRLERLKRMVGKSSVKPALRYQVKGGQIEISLLDEESISTFSMPLHSDDSIFACGANTQEGSFLAEVQNSMEVLALKDFKPGKADLLSLKEEDGLLRFTTPQVNLQVEGFSQKEPESLREQHLGNLCEEEPDMKEVLTLPMNEWATVMERCIPASSTETSRYYLCCVVLVEEQGHAAFAATDGHRLHFSKTEVPYKASTPLLIPTQLCQRLLSQRDLKGQVSLLQGVNRIAFRGESFQLHLPSLEGSFPDYKQVIPKASADVFEVDLLDLKKALQVLKKVQSTRKDSVTGCRYLFGKDEITLKISKMEIKCPAKRRWEDPHEIGLSIQYMLEALDQLDGKTAYLAFNNHLMPIIVSGVSDFKAANFFGVVMPMRL